MNDVINHQPKFRQVAIFFQIHRMFDVKTGQENIRMTLDPSCQVNFKSIMMGRFWKYDQADPYMFTSADPSKPSPGMHCWGPGVRSTSSDAHPIRHLFMSIVIDSLSPTPTQSRVPNLFPGLLRIFRTNHAS